MAHQSQVGGLKLVGVHLPGGQESLAEDGRIEDLDPKDAMV